METSDDSDEEGWFISHIKVEVGGRKQWGTMMAGRLVRILAVAVT